ncbi:peptidase C1 [Luteimonas yindakuii]|uniref:Peptidase C1 n=1 Tax=Luteimonas yindakuii TaxID=2565782 RepID=A0A4Z1R5I2_9GAMM|nr:C1 family peptidase [Luteimonas yindakuii]TKS53795.1 peptidase C1 [Luteimonas yindakuii]
MPARTARQPERLLDARPDTADFRDRMFDPTLVDVPPTMPLDRHLKRRVPVLDQGGEGACTAFALVTVAHTLLRSRRPRPLATRLSPRMAYDMARRYDEWEGEDYAGSSCRGAMKGWHRHGLATEAVWPWRARAEPEAYTERRARDAQRHPLGAYARVNHRDLVAMHVAIAETGVLYASAAVHEGWLKPPASGAIAWRQQDVTGYHAFAIVGYDARGFWIQNSWGTGWGRNGHAHLGYDEWLERGTDTWVGRLAVPVQVQRPATSAVFNSALAAQSTGYSQADLRPHIVSLGNDGRLRSGGRFGNSQDDIRNLVRNDLPRITRGWSRKRILLYAHGGLVPEQAAVQRVADYRQSLLGQEIYPLAFIWKTDLWTTLGNLLRDAARPRSEGLLERTRDLLLDRLDDTLEPLARVLGGRAMWEEMKENALLATTAVSRDGQGGLQEAGGAAQVARLLHDWQQRDPTVEIHVAAHSAGSILLAPLVQLLTTEGQIASGPAAGMLGLGGKIESAHLWAPALTTGLFLQTFAPALRERRIDRASLFTLTDRAERDDHCARVYNKSLLYLVAHAFEATARNWIDRDRRHGTPLAGMALFIEHAEFGNAEMRALIRDGLLDWIQAPTVDEAAGSPDASEASNHAAFDDDAATLCATVSRILDVQRSGEGVDIHRSSAGLDARRRRLYRAICGAP